MNKKLKFANQVVIITGASSGIGKETALAFAREGAITVLSSRSLDKLNRVAEECQKYQAQTYVVPADVSSQAQVQNLVNQVLKRFGRVDILINNAGGVASGNIENPDFANDVRELFETDYLGKVYCAQAVLPHMRRQGRGFIVNLSSVVGRKPFPSFAAYATTMHAVSAFSDALRQELAGTGIHVSTIYPALTQTNFLQGFEKHGVPPTFRIMKLLTAETIAKAILKTIIKKKPRAILPWQPRILIVSDSIASALGDLVVRLLQKRWFMSVMRMYDANNPAVRKAS